MQKKMTAEEIGEKLKSMDVTCVARLRGEPGDADKEGFKTSLIGQFSDRLDMAEMEKLGKSGAIDAFAERYFKHCSDPIGKIINASDLPVSDADPSKVGNIPMPIAKSALPEKGPIPPERPLR